MTAYPEVDYLAIGHASLDLIPSGSIPGGSVTYAARVAEALGCRAAVVTSVASDFDLESAFPGMAIENVPSGTTTTFENIYKDDRRRQKIYTVASSIEKKHIPSSWIRAPIVHLGPIANEIDPSIISLFSNSIVGLTPQGWLRTWNERGQVRSCDWPEANDVLPMAAAVILSVEDLHDPSVLEVYRERARLLVLTEQAGGCTVHCRGESRHFPAPQVIEVNPTGSGDSFAAAYFIRLHQTRGNPWDSAEFANRVAAASVTKKTIEDKIVAISKIVDGGYDSDLQVN